jgi:predicted amidohydrolase
MVDESTPLVAVPKEAGRRRDFGLGFALGTCFVASLIGSFALGRSTVSVTAGGGVPASTAGTDSDDSIKIHTTYADKVDGSETTRFIATQFISFTINTLGGRDDMGECEGKEVDTNSGLCYLGNSYNITEDVMHRLAIASRIIAKIKQNAFAESPDIDYADDVLKIVMLPEFFWRGPYGAYSTKQILDPDDGVLVKVSDKMRNAISEEFFRDFLFVFGTVISAESPLKRPEKASDLEYFNYAMVAKGGPHGQVFVVTKKYISGADFLSRTTLPNPSLEDMHEYAQFDPKFLDFFAKRNSTVITDNVIELDGLRIGVEICLDHRVGQLWNTLRSRYHSQLVDILLITSAGMAIERGPNPVVPGGVVYLCDGGASSAACIRTDNGPFYPNQVCRDNIGGLKHIPVGGPGYSSFFGLHACWDLEDIELLEGYYSLYLEQGCAFTLKTYDIDVYDDYKYYPPSIEIYPTVDLPKSTYKKRQ